MSFQYLNIMME